MRGSFCARRTGTAGSIAMVITATMEPRMLSLMESSSRNRLRNFRFGAESILPALPRPTRLSRGGQVSRTRIVTVVIIVMAVAAAVGAQKNTPKKPAVPIYKVDPFWPKPLPNNWIIQGVPVMVADKNDHIWVISRPRDINPDESGAATNPPRTDCCVAAPAVLEFDTAGNLLSSWGKPDYVEGWPAQGVARPGAGAEHAIAVDREGNVWIDGNYRGDGIQKFSKDG